MNLAEADSIQQGKQRVLHAWPLIPLALTWKGEGPLGMLLSSCLTTERQRHRRR
jgi:hypothetical protein